MAVEQAFVRSLAAFVSALLAGDMGVVYEPGWRAQLLPAPWGVKCGQAGWRAAHKKLFPNYIWNLNLILDGI